MTELEGRAPFLQHLEELRTRLIRSLIAIAAGFGLCYWKVKDLFAFRFEDFTLENYDPHPHIKGAVAV